MPGTKPLTRIAYDDIQRKNVQILSDPNTMGLKKKEKRTDTMFFASKTKRKTNRKNAQMFCIQNKKMSLHHFNHTSWLLEGVKITKIDTKECVCECMCNKIWTQLVKNLDLAKKERRKKKKESIQLSHATFNLKTRSRSLTLERY